MILRGRVVGLRAGIARAMLPVSRVGQRVGVVRNDGTRVAGTVRAIDSGETIVALHASCDAISSGAAVWVEPGAERVPLGTCALGRAIDARGQSLDGSSVAGPLRAIDAREAHLAQRRAIRAPFWTGLRAIDGLLPLGKGARIGIFGGAGLGKTTLLQRLLAGARADAVVVALIGERGREARSAIDALDRYTTVVCATSDRSASERWRAAQIAMAQARALCERGLDVLVVLDSLARTAAALRELGIAAGESAGRGGYPPSVVAGLAGLLECAGAFSQGSITLVASVLSDGDDRDPISEAARSLLDGHVQLSQTLAERGHFPAIAIPASASRTAPEVATREHLAAARAVRAALASLERSEDARMLGLTPQDDALARACQAQSALDAFLRQGSTPSEPRETLVALESLARLL